MIEFSVLDDWPNAGLCLRAPDGGSAGTELRSRLAGEYAEFRSAGNSSVAAPELQGKQRLFRGHSELFSRIGGLTSDQKRTEEILKRTGVALSQRDCRLEDHAVDEAAGALV